MNTLKYIGFILIVFITACSSSSDNIDFKVSSEGVKSLSSDISKVDLIPQINNKGYLIEIDINKNPFTGGAQDWNSIAIDVHSLAEKLFMKNEVYKVNFYFKSPDSNNLQWAMVSINRDNLIKDWKDLTYLQFFSFSEQTPGTIDVSKWLCDFYDKYESARPKAYNPSMCKQ